MPAELIQISVPIERVDEAERIVEGYAFVNETVPGEGGMRLKRAAMEAATADYMKWGALREMHQPSAAGTTLGIEWDEKGARIRAKVVDDQAWKKVTERVYKAFSIGVQPTVVRGKDVEACRWAETSLVDRPKDEGAAIEVFRIEMPEPSDAPDLSRIEEFVERGDFAKAVEANEKHRLRHCAIEWLSSLLLWPKTMPPSSGVREILGEFALYWESRGLSEGYNRGDKPEVERAQESGDVPARENLEGKKKKCRDCGSTDLVDEDDETEPKRSDGAMLTRLAALESDLDRERSEKEALQVRVAQLENEPRRERPVKFAGKAIERTFAGAQEGPVDVLRGELAGIMDRAKATNLSDEDRRKMALRISGIKAELREYGVAV